MVKTTRKKSYHGYETRLETFSGARLQGSKPRSRKVSWPHAKPAAHQLAKAGFYFTPAPTEYGADLVTCYMCGSGIDGWEPEDDPLLVHAENCTSCPLAIFQSKPWDSAGSTHDPRSTIVMSARLQTYYQPLTNEELEDAIVNSSTEVPDNLDSPSKVALLSASALPLMGTSVWPHDSKKGWTPTSERMAQAGFYYSPNQMGEDYGLCAYCGLGLDGWEPSDDPIGEHQRRSPTCIFFDMSLTTQDIPSRIPEIEEQASVEISESDDGNESQASTASTSKRKKKTSAASKTSKRASKRTSAKSDYSDSDASTMSTTSSKRKRGRPSRKATIESSVPEKIEKKKARLSAYEDESQLFTSLESNSEAVNSTLETMLAPSTTRSAHVPKGSVSSKISEFEGYAVKPTRPAKGTKVTKLSQSSSPPNMGLEDAILATSSPPHSASQSVKDIEPSKKVELLIEGSPISAIDTNQDDSTASKLSQESKTEPSPPPKQIPTSPWLPKPESPPRIFQDESDDDENDISIKAEQPILNPPPKIPLHDTSPHARNATPPPSNYPVKHISMAEVAADSPPDSPLYANNNNYSPKWAAIETDVVFELLNAVGTIDETKSSSKGKKEKTNNTGLGIISGSSREEEDDDNDNEKQEEGEGEGETQQDVLLGEQQLNKTVHEWINSAAIEGERRLKAKCEALVAILEKESERAVAAIEALPVKR